MIQTGYAQLQSDRFVIDQWTIEDGLPQNTIVDIEQTDDGYLWLATNGGLVRFDGANFHVYTKYNTGPLKSNRINALQEDDTGRLWIGTQKGVLMHDGNSFNKFSEDEGFGTFAVQEDGFAIDSKGRLWIIASDTTGSLNQIYIYDDSQFLPLSDFFGDQTEEVPESAIALAKGLEGRIWVIKEDGIIRYKEKTFTAFNPFDNYQPDRIIKYRDELGQEQLYFVTQQNNHLIFRDGQFQAASSEKKALFEKHKWWWMTAPGKATVLFDDGELVIQNQPKNLPTLEMNFFYIDREDNIWVAARKTGLYRFKPTIFDVISEGEGMVGEAVLAVEEIADDTIAAITNCQGFNRIRQTGPHSYNADRPGESTCLRALYGEDDGTYWWGHKHLYYATETDTTEYQLGRDMWVIYEDPIQEAVLWIGTNNGAYYFEDGEFTRIGMGQSRLKNRVHNFLRDSRGRLWAATEGGLARMSAGDSTFTFIAQESGMATGSIRALFEDPAEPGVIWAGTYGSGLLHYKDGSLTRITRDDGLFDNVVSSILPDDYGNVWMSGNRGIYRIKMDELRAFVNGDTDYITSIGYGREAGLENPETNGAFQPAAIKDSGGKLWYPTLGGVAVIDPAEVAADTVPPITHIEDLLFHNQPLETKNSAALLEKGQRSFQINYTGISLSSPQKVRFRYRLKGLEDEWTQAGSRREVFFANVPPGNYTFQVQAANRDGVWSKEIANLTINVPAYLYEMTWFWLVLGIAFLAGTYLLYHRRIKSHKRREEKLNTLVSERTEELAASKNQIAKQAEKLKELDEIKNQFFTNISHELRTPLTLILGPLKNIMKGVHGNIPEHLLQQIKLIHRNSQRLLVLVKKLLDLSRIESGDTRLQVSKQDLSKFVKKTAMGFTPHAETKKITLNINVQSEPCLFYYDPIQLGKVIANLLSNALKFTPQGGQVYISLQQQDDRAHIVVEDTGIGIDNEELKHIFNRFYQVDGTTTRRDEGTGIGLALAKELVELHHGKLSVESAEGKGSTFTISLQKGKSHFRDEQLTEEDVPPEDRKIETDIHSLEVDRVTANGDDKKTPISTTRREDQTTVLVIDDNDDIRTYMKSILQPDYTVIEAVNGVDGMKIAREQLPDLIICDVMMPELDGFDLSRKLRKDAMTECIPFIFVTAKVEKADHIEGLDTGADDYITKPFDAEILLSRTQNLLEQRRRLRKHALEKMQQKQNKTDSLSFEQRIRQIIQNHLPDSDFTVEKLADEMSLSRSYLTRKVKNEFGKTPGKLIRNMRLEHAIRLLRNQSGNISEIAYSVGFNSLSYFSRCFKDKYDVAPSAYMAEAS